MSQFVVEVGTPVNLTSTGDVIASTDCVLLGFYVHSTTAGTVRLRSGGSAGTLISGLITPSVGWHRFPASVPGGLHVQITNTIDVNFFVIEGVS